MTLESLETLLAAIPWSDQAHAYGTAESIPDHLRSLLSTEPELRGEARRYLRTSVIHQNAHWPGSPETTRCLLAIAVDPGAPDRGAVLDLIRYLATRYETPSRRVFEEFPHWQATADESHELWKRCRVEVERRLDDLVSMLTAPDVKIQVATILLLAWLPSAAEAALPILLKILRTPESHAAASAALAIGALGRMRNDASHVGALRAVLGDPDAEVVVGHAAAVGMSWLGCTLDEDVVARLASAIEDLVEEEGLAAPELWSLAVDEYCPTSAATPAPIAHAIFEALRYRRFKEQGDPERLGDPLLGVVFPKVECPAAWLPEELTPRQRACLDVLTGAVRHKASYADPYYSNLDLKHRGIPAHFGRLKLYLGHAPPDLLERRSLHARSAGEPAFWPLWKYLVTISHECPPIEEGAVELLRHLTARELVELHRRGVAEVRRCWSCGEGRLEDYVERAMERRFGEAIPPTLEADSPMSCWRSTTLEKETLFDLWLQLRTTSSDEDVRRLEKLLPFAITHAPPAQPWLRKWLQELPDARVAQVFEAVIPTEPAYFMPRDPATEIWNLPVLHGPWIYLDRAPTLAVAEQVVRIAGEVTPWSYPLDDVLGYLSRLPEVTFLAVEASFRGGSARAKTLLRRAAWVRGAPLTNAALREDLRDWFHNGATLRSGESEHRLMLPCPFCARVLNHLRLQPETDPGTASGILVNYESSDVERKRAYVHAHWRGAHAKLEVSRDEPLADADHDAAIAEAVESARASYDGGDDVDLHCVELRGLHRFAHALRQYYAACALRAGDQ